jgi:hypothetical protein
MSPESATLDIGDTQQFTLVGDGDPSSPDIVWELDPDNGVASVDQNGLVTALASGSTTLRAGGCEAHIQVLMAAPTIDGANTTIAVVDGNVVATVQASGDGIQSLEVDHNAEGTLPEFSVYADPANVWGDAESATQAAAAGLEATYADGLWTLTFLQGGAALQTFVDDYAGNIQLYLVVHNAEGKASGTMDGGNYHRLEITV